MNATPRPNDVASRPARARFASRTLIVALVLGIALPATWACERDTDAAETSTQHVAQADPSAEPSGATTGPNYTIAHPAAHVAVDEAGQIELSVTPSPGFKVNTEYPWELTLSAAEGVSLGASELDRAGATELTDELAHYEVPVTAAAAGQHDVEGHLRFSICNDARCDVLQAQVSWTVTAE